MTGPIREDELIGILMDNTITWKPKNPQNTNMWKFLCFINQKYKENFKEYSELHTWSINNLPAFWEALNEFYAISYDTPPLPSS